MVTQGQLQQQKHPTQGIHTLQNPIISPQQIWHFSYIQGYQIPSIYSNPQCLMVDIFDYIKQGFNGIKFNNKMGNIQVMQTKAYSHRKSIFDVKRKARDTLKDKTSPFAKTNNVVRYSPSPNQRKNQLTEKKSNSRNQHSKSHSRSRSGFNKRDEPFFRATTLKKKDFRLPLQLTKNQPEDHNIASDSYQNSQRSHYFQNRQKCNDIIKKVRNFNDFLNELKIKLRQDYGFAGNAAIGEKVEGKLSKRPILERIASKQICMSLKLQNERIELQKYKRLVERQLSKNHSIQNISIENGQKGQKILRIQYEHLDSRASLKQALINDSNAEKSRNLKIQSSDQQLINLPTCQIPVPSQGESGVSTESIGVFSERGNDSYSIRLAESKRLHAIMKQRLDDLQKLLILEESDEVISGEGLSDYLRWKEKMVRVDVLVDRGQQINIQINNFETKILNLLQQTND